ncbi:MAG: hypothetical protein WBH14_06220 [Albidovulum sp.]
MKYPSWFNNRFCFVSGSEVSDDALSKAKFHRKTATFRGPFFLRQYGGRSLLDQIGVEYSPKDDLFNRRAALTISVAGLVEHDIQTRMTENLHESGFVPGKTLDTGYTTYSDDSSEIEVFVYVKDESESISLRKT